ncbi:guanylate kinase [Buchnera aphidicola]|nr:guanylate kinase [Buchnera aphidicola]
MSIGVCFIFSAPSGAGKSSLIQALLHEKFSYKIQLSVSYTTRQIRPGEIHNEHYYFVSKPKFKEMIKQKKFVEYAKVFNHYYGTSKNFILKRINSGIDVFLDIDWQGAKQIRKKFPNSKSIFILPPSKAELLNRLKIRAQDDSNVIVKRMKNVVYELIHFFDYDYLVINDKFKNTVNEIKKIINCEQFRLHYCRKKYILLIKNLINWKNNTC